MIHSHKNLKTQYSFSDFLFYICLLAVPILTAAHSILEHSIWWTVAFVAIAVGATVLVLRFFCTRCPHYTGEGNSLKCIFFWGLPKFFDKRPGKLEAMDQLITFGATAVLLLFPVYWLLMEPVLLIIYVLSIIGLGAAIYRNECERCIYRECPMNRVPADSKNP